MIASIKAKAAVVVVSGSLLVAGYAYWQHLTGERDAHQAEAQRQQARADILQEHQAWQRQQIETLHDSMARRDEMLTALADDMRASRDALDQLGEQNAEIRDWLDRDVPAGIDDWVRQLQQPSTGNGVRLPNDTGTADE